LSLIAGEYTLSPPMVTNFSSLGFWRLSASISALGFFDQLNEK
jgi:hypothetical protein